MSTHRQDLSHGAAWMRGEIMPTSEAAIPVTDWGLTHSDTMSTSAGKAIRQEVRSWSIPKRSDKSIEDLSAMFGAKIQGWINYYGRFYRSQMYMTLRHINKKLMWWAMRKYKKLYRHRRRAMHWLGHVAKRFPSLFPHWRMGLLPTVG